MEEKVHLKIALLTTSNPLSRNGPADITHYIYRALQEHYNDVERVEATLSPGAQAIGRILNKMTHLIIGRDIAYHHLSYVLKREAQIIERRLQQQNYDLIVAVEATPLLAFIHTKIPIVLVEAATFSQRNQYDSGTHQLYGRSAARADKVESRAYNNADIILLNSQWAAQSMIQEYYIDPQKIYIIPFGAPLSTTPPKEIALTRRRSYCCTLLFIGDDWQHKGGDIAYTTLLMLEQVYNIQAELIVCGTTPPARLKHPRLEVIPTLDLNDTMQRHELEHLYLRSDFLLLPTNRDITGMLCSEASAYGVPSLVMQGGAIADIVRNGLNGIQLPADAHGAEYAHQVAKIYLDERSYATLVHTSRQLFEEQLNWDAWGKAFKVVTQSQPFFPIAQADRPPRLKEPEVFEQQP